MINVQGCSLLSNSGALRYTINYDERVTSGYGDSNRREGGSDIWGED